MISFVSEITSALMTFVVASGLPAGAEDMALEGRCIYAPKYTELLKRGDHSFALCDSVSIKLRGETTIIDFAREGWGSSLQLRGTMDGSKMSVSEISIRGHEPAPARGECRIALRENDRHIVTCLAQKRGISFVANFEQAWN